MTVRIYLRVSTGHQAESGLGIEGQRSRCEEFVSKHYDQRECSYYIDSGVSGSLDIHKRPELNRLFSEMATGDVLLAYDSSRIARDTMVWLNIELSCKKQGVDIALTSGNNGNSLETALLRRIMAQIDEYALNKTRERTRLALKVLKEEKGVKLGQAPYGYAHSKNRKSFVTVESEQAVIHIVSDLRGSGSKWKDILDYLNENGYTNRRGKRWSQSLISNTLRKAVENYNGESKK